MGGWCLISRANRQPLKTSRAMSHDRQLGSRPSRARVLAGERKHLPRSERLSKSGTSIEKLGLSLPAHGLADVRVLEYRAPKVRSLVTVAVIGGLDLVTRAEEMYSYGETALPATLLRGEDVTGWFTIRSGEARELKFTSAQTVAVHAAQCRTTGQ